MRGLVNRNSTTGLEDTVLFLFTFKPDSVPNTRPFLLPELVVYTVFLRAPDVTDCM